MKIVLGSIVVVVVVASLVFVVAKRRSDGPFNAMIPGGPMTSGELLPELPAGDWSGLQGKIIELELVGTGSTRYTGLMVHNGALFIPCDLGFVWNRLSGAQRWPMHAVYLFKRWHKDAAEDGRVVLRVDGKRYERHAVRVTEPSQVAALKQDLEVMARKWFAPKEIGPAPTEGPRDIWFFRLDPRGPSDATSADRGGPPSTHANIAARRLLGHRPDQHLFLFLIRHDPFDLRTYLRLRSLTMTLTTLLARLRFRRTALRGLYWTFPRAMESRKSTSTP